MPLPHSKNISRQITLLLLLSSLTFSTLAQNNPVPNSDESGGFKGGVTPSRFELKAEPGDIVKEKLSIYNLGDKPENFAVETNDWLFSEAGQLTFSDRLISNSCRQWVRLERHQLKILPSAYRARTFRFEVHVPSNAAPQECRFAIMISSLGDAYLPKIGAGIALPATGRVGIIVYLSVGEANPDTQVIDFSTVKIDYLTLPVVQVKNNGTAHDRLDSELTATDASGSDFRISVASTPILPGQTRSLIMQPQDEKQNSAIDYPITIKGRIFTKTDTYQIEKVIK